MMEKSNLVPFIRKDLHILFIGLNPAKGSSDNRHYFSVYQSFWNQLYDTGLITTKVNKLVADEIVFGSNAINFHGWNYGITDLVTEYAESDSGKIKPEVTDCERLKATILKFAPKVAILIHKKVTRNFLTYLGRPLVAANHGQIGKILDNCPTMFYSIAFPHVNNIPSKEKVEKYLEVMQYLLILEEHKG
jgi:hypothetical protein